MKKFLLASLLGVMGLFFFYFITAVRAEHSGTFNYFSVDVVENPQGYIEVIQGQSATVNVIIRGHSNTACSPVITYTFNNAPFSFSSGGGSITPAGGNYCYPAGSFSQTVQFTIRPPASWGPGDYGSFYVDAFAGGFPSFWSAYDYDQYILRVLPPPLPTGTISASPNPCSIPSGQSTCSTTISWSSSNAATPWVCVDTGGGNKGVWQATSGSEVAPWITTASDFLFTLYDGTNGCGNTQLAQVRVKAS